MAIELYIKRLDAIGQPPLLPQVQRAAKQIRIYTTPLAERASLKPLGRDYLKRFATRYKIIRKVR